MKLKVAGCEPIWLSHLFIFVEFPNRTNPISGTYFVPQSLFKGGRNSDWRQVKIVRPQVSTQHHFTVQFIRRSFHSGSQRWTCGQYHIYSDSLIANSALFYFQQLQTSQTYLCNQDLCALKSCIKRLASIFQKTDFTCIVQMTKWEKWISLLGLENSNDPHTQEA